jgi:purine-binding chemotaxis protein CheW
MAQLHNAMDILNLQLTEGDHDEQFIIFSVGTEEYGLNVLRVQEIIRYLTPTKVPHAPSFVEGVIDFRGEVIPVLNLRNRFNLPPKEYDPFSVIIVIEANGKIVGLTVDQVSDIINIPKERIHPAPDFASQKNTRYLTAMGKLDERLILIIDLDKIMDLNEQEHLEELITEAVPENLTEPSAISAENQTQETRES